MKKTILLIAILMVASSAYGQMTKTEQAVLMLNQEYDEAILRNDAAAMERILADDYMYTNADGKVENKAQSIAETKAGKYKFETVKSDDVQVRIYGDTAVVTAVWMAKGTEEGKAFNLKERYTAIFVKRKGKWQIVAEQGTTVMQ